MGWVRLFFFMLRLGNLKIRRHLLLARKGFDRPPLDIRVWSVLDPGICGAQHYVW